MDESIKTIKTVPNNELSVSVDSHYSTAPLEVAEEFGLNWATDIDPLRQNVENSITESMTAVVASLAAAATAAYERETCIEVPKFRKKLPALIIPAPLGIDATNFFVRDKAVPSTAQSQPVISIPAAMDKPNVCKSSPSQKVQIPIKKIISLAQLKERIVESSKGAISKDDPSSDSYCVDNLVAEYVGTNHVSYFFYSI